MGIYVNYGNVTSSFRSNILFVHYIISRIKSLSFGQISSKSVTTPSTYFRTVSIYAHSDLDYESAYMTY